MKKLLFALLLLPAISNAQSYTYGCFVENGSIYCSTGEITCGTFGNVASFGPTVGSLCNQYILALGELVTETQRADINYNAYLTAEAGRLDWIAFANKKVALIKRLRKACGSKCKLIK